MSNMTPDHNLKLSTAFHNGNYTIMFFKRFALGFFGILEVKPQPGRTVDKSVDIGFTADEAYDVISHFFMIHVHSPLWSNCP
ncbi:hypothetical protein D3C76_1384490 [compost metagenome]